MSLYPLLDAITSNDGGTITHECHDLNQINWVRGMTDPGEMIGCGRYQQLRRLADESDETYQARLVALLADLPTADRRKIEEFGRAAALRRASLAVVNGKVALAVAGKLPWSGLGTTVADAMTSAQAISLAHLDWEVLKIQNQFTHEGQTRKALSWTIARGDTGEALGSVGARYAPIQNKDGFKFLDSVLAQFGAKYESAGALYNGSTVFMVARMPEQAFSVNGTDEVLPFVLFTNTHDGTGAARCFPTSVRVECANTLRNSLGDRAEGSGINIRHTGSVSAKVHAAQHALGLSVKAFDDFRQAAEGMAHATCDLVPYANDVLDMVLEISAADAAKGSSALARALNISTAEQELKAKSIEKQISRRKEVLADILDRYEGPKNGVNGMRGSVWSAFNAITEHADHSRPSRQASNVEDRQSRRFESIINGPADEMKQVAYTQALALAR